MSHTTRGSAQVKGLASLQKTGATSGARHVRHFQVASLEIERSRRARERKDMIERLRATEQRLDEIDDLLHGHYVALGLQEGADGAAEGAAPPDALPLAGSSFPRPGAQAPEPPRGSPRRVVLYGR